MRWWDGQSLFKMGILLYLPPPDMLSHNPGFHPSQILNSYMGTWLWDIISTDHPDWIGKENPHNAEINAMFGDQGGY